MAICPSVLVGCLFVFHGKGRNRAPPSSSRTSLPIIFLLDGNPSHQLSVVVEFGLGSAFVCVCVRTAPSFGGGLLGEKNNMEKNGNGTTTSGHRVTGTEGGEVGEPPPPSARSDDDDDVRHRGGPSDRRPTQVAHNGRVLSPSLPLLPLALGFPPTNATHSPGARDHEERHTERDKREVRLFPERQRNRGPPQRLPQNPGFSASGAVDAVRVLS
eukprot:gene4697-3390_t